MTAPIALQLYSVRSELEQDFEGTLAKIASMGYTAVETGAFAGDAERQKAALDNLGLEVMAAHVRPPLGEFRESTLAFMDTLGIERLVVPYLDPVLYFQSEEGIKQAADVLNETAAVCAEYGLRPHYHNHDFEFATVNGRLAFDLLLQSLDPSVLFEVDTYWVQTAGVDAAKIVSELGSRAPLLHIKDGLLQRGLPMVAAGDGQMDFKKVIPAGGENTEWLIVELDECAGDMLHAVARSLNYLQNFAV